MSMICKSVWRNERVCDVLHQNVSNCTKCQKKKRKSYINKQNHNHNLVTFTKFIVYLLNLNQCYEQKLHVFLRKKYLNNILNTVMLSQTHENNSKNQKIAGANKCTFMLYMCHNTLLRTWNTTKHLPNEHEFFQSIHLHRGQFGMAINHTLGSTDNLVESHIESLVSSAVSFWSQLKFPFLLRLSINS